MEQLTLNQRYRIDQRIGEGGMSVVYRGRDLFLRRTVAIKVLRPHYAADPELRARFAREARAIAGLSHPHIIDIYDVGEDQGTPYIIMEYIDGETLKQIIVNEGPFPPDDVAALLDQVASALDYAHERGVIHRDIKPQNILVAADGHATVVDFGLAKSLTDTSLTAAGASLGTLHYTSPEQISGLIATPASDIYALAVVAFEMLTKRVPFDADTPVGIAIQHVQATPPRPSAFNPAVPLPVDAIVLRGLAKDPDHRYLSAGAFAAAMDDWDASRPARAAQPRPEIPPDTPLTTVRLPPPPPVSFPLPSTELPPVGQTWAPTRWPSEPRRARLSARRVSLIGAVSVAAVIALVWLASSHSGWFYDTGTAPSPPTTVAAAVTSSPTTAVAVAPPANTSVATGTVDVPDVTGESVDDATALLNGHGLQIQDMGSMYSDDVPAGAIAVQDPAAGTQAELGSTVYIKQSLGSATINLAKLKLIGSDPTDATNLLLKEGLNVEQDKIASDSVPAGKVAGIDPPRSATVGQTVLLHISAGKVAPGSTAASAPPDGTSS